MRVTIGLLAWNNWDDTADCLASLAACEGDFDILVIDNGSTDGTPERVREQYPRAEVHSLGENLGVAGGYNRGMAHAFARGAEAVLLLNNDTLAGPTLVSDMAKVLEERPDVGVVLPKIYLSNEKVGRTSDRLWFAGAHHRPFPPAHKMRGTNDPDGPEYSVPGEIAFAPSCCMLVRREIFEQTGGFDERYFFFYDDWDFCARVREGGSILYYQPSAQLWHKVAQSTMGSRRPERWWRVFGQSAVRYYRDHESWPVLWMHILWITMREAAKGNPRALPPFWQGCAAQLRGPTHG